MDRKVTVLTPHGRRHTVSVTQNTTLLQILETTCAKYGFDSDEYCLKHHNKAVGLTQTFRFSGLPNNCLLEMEQLPQRRVMQNVDICVQLQDGRRVQAQFPPSKSVLDVLEQLSSTELDACESPVVLYMRQEIVGKESMGKTTLKSLGITEGRAMLRLIDKRPEDLKTQASVYVAPTAKEKPKANDDDDDRPRSTRDKTGSSSGGFAITTDLVRSLKKPEPKVDENAMDTSETNESPAKEEPKAPEPPKPKYDWGTGSGQSVGGTQAMDVSRKNLNEQFEEDNFVEPEYKIIGDRNALIYTLDAVKVDAEDLPDSFYDLTVTDLKLVLRDLKKIAAGNEDAPLLTEKLRELEQSKQMLNKIATYKNCVVRVQFPNRYVLQGMFKPTDTIGTVQEWLNTFIIGTASNNYHLYTIPPKQILPVDKTLLELDFVPNALVHFSYNEDAPPSLSPKHKAPEEIPYIDSKYLAELTSPEAALYVAKKFRKQIERDSNIVTTDDRPSTSHTLASQGAIPKRPRHQD